MILSLTVSSTKKHFYKCERTFFEDTCASVYIIHNFAEKTSFFHFSNHMHDLLFVMRFIDVMSYYLL